MVSSSYNPSLKKRPNNRRNSDSEIDSSSNWEGANLEEDIDYVFGKKGTAPVEPDKSTRTPVGKFTAKESAKSTEDKGKEPTGRAF